MHSADTLAFEKNDDDGSMDMFWLCVYCISCLMMVYTLYRGGKKAISAAKEYNRLDLDDESAKAIAGFLQAYMHTFHTTKDTLPLPEDEAAIIAVGPHKTGAVDAFSFAANVKGKTPRFFATNTFFQTPLVGGGIKWFMTKFNVIVVDFGKQTEGKVNARQAVLDAGNKALEEKGRVAVFPQGNFAYIGKEAPIVYSGTARMAIKNGLPIHLVRLDGFKSLENGWPVFVRNNSIYRALGTLFHRNNIKTNLCWAIDVHLRGGNQFLSEEEKIRLINAEMYAFFRHIEELTPARIEKIKSEIALGLHLKVWDNRFGKYSLEKQLAKLDSEFSALDKQLAEMPKIVEIPAEGDASKGGLEVVPHRPDTLLVPKARRHSGEFTSEFEEEDDLDKMSRAASTLG